MKYLADRTTIKFSCPKCRNEFGRLLSWVKPGDALVCPKCSHSFVDVPLLKEAETKAQLLKPFFPD